MFHEIGFLKAIFFDYPVLKYLVVFFGTALGGEIFLVAFAFLSAQGLISLYTLVPLSFLGTTFADTSWFLLSRTKIVSRLFEHRYATPAVTMITTTISRISKGSHFLALVFAKFLYGTRIITIIYVSKTHLSLKKFLHYNTYAVLFWVAAVIPIGYASGLGYTYISHFFQNLYASITFAVLVLIFIILFQRWLKNRISREK
jgi:membrane protein DedA with SNARE-associated domain